MGAERRPFDAGEIFGFVMGQPIDCRSSNVVKARWNPATDELFVWCTGNRPTKTRGPVEIYRYRGVGRDLARDFAHASSKGTWVWDNLRRPGWNFDIVTEGEALAD